MASVNPQLLHLLRRAGFGPTWGDLQRYDGVALPTVVDHLLDTSAAPPVTPPGSLGGPTIIALRDLQDWWYDRMSTTAVPLVEKVGLFWHGHFVASTEHVPQMFNMNQLMRTLGFGSFEALFQAVAIEPAMLTYLNGAKNVAPTPNENFARESMELMSLGVGQYTQTDVLAAAHAWTGYNLDDSKHFVYNAAAHDPTPQTFLGITKSWSGPQVIDEICTGRGAATCASFIASELWSFFAYPNPESSVVSSLAGPFLSSGLNISTLLRTIFNHPQFYGAEAQGALIRTPADWLASALRHTGTAAASATPWMYSDQMGQTLFRPPNVAGWGQNAYWISDSATWGKASCARAIAGQVAYQSSFQQILQGPNAIPTMLAALGVFFPSPQLTTALTQWLTANPKAMVSHQVFSLVVLTLLSPDFQLA